LVGWWLFLFVSFTDELYAAFTIWRWRDVEDFLLFQCGGNRQWGGLFFGICDVFIGGGIEVRPEKKQARKKHLMMKCD